MKGTDVNDFASAAVQAPGPLFAEQTEIGMFAASKVAPTAAERVVAEIIAAHPGRKNAISIAMLCKCTGKKERAIKGIVEQLVVTHRMRIGGYRGTDDGPVGYAMIIDREDHEAAVGPYRSQIFAMWRRLRALMAPHELAELYGQLAIKE